jgi:hypothetical protein
MSNYLSFAAVSATIGTVISEGMFSTLDVSSTPQISYGPPPKTDNQFVGLNIFLYQVAPNASLRNLNLPMRKTAGQILQDLSIGYDLSYMITFYGDENKLEPQRLMGSALDRLMLHSTLDRDIIYQTTSSDKYPYLHDSDLHNQIKHIALESMQLSIDELFKLWSTFSKTKYHLSIFYKASVVMLSPVVSEPEASSANHE